MNKARTLFIFGVWIAVLPYLGFPSFWRNILFTLSGLILIYFGYAMYHENSKKKISQRKTFDNFSENHDFHEKEDKNISEGSLENIN